MKHIRSVSIVPAVAQVDVPALVKSSADAVAVLAVGFSVSKLLNNLNGVVSGLDLQSKTS